jgi:hypothetical protein
MKSINLLDQVTFIAMRKDPELCGRLLAYLDTALRKLPESSVEHRWIADQLAKDVAKIKESGG